MNSQSVSYSPSRACYVEVNNEEDLPITARTDKPGENEQSDIGCCARFMKWVIKKPRYSVPLFIGLAAGPAAIAGAAYQLAQNESALAVTTAVSLTYGRYNDTLAPTARTAGNSFADCDDSREKLTCVTSFSVDNETALADIPFASAASNNPANLQKAYKLINKKVDGLFLLEDDATDRSVVLSFDRYQSVGSVEIMFSVDQRAAVKVKPYQSQTVKIEYRNFCGEWQSTGSFNASDDQQFYPLKSIVTVQSISFPEVITNQFRLTFGQSINTENPVVSILEISASGSGLPTDTPAWKSLSPPNCMKESTECGEDSLLWDQDGARLTNETAADYCRGAGRIGVRFRKRGKEP